MKRTCRFTTRRVCGTGMFVVLAGVILGVALPACEEADITNFPYVERIVVRSILDPGEDSLLVLFSRTLPLSEPYDASSAVLTDVDASITFESRSYPLVHVGGGHYRAPGLSLVHGGTYGLQASWNGKSVSATTRIPSSPVIRGATQIPSDAGTTLATVVEAHGGEVYGQTWEVHSANEHTGGGSFTQVLRAEDAGVSGVVELTEDYEFQPAVEETLYAVVHAFDRPFYDYFISRGGNTQEYDDLLFRPVSGFVNWNVTGDGIGLFLGRALGRKKAEIP